jgi:hypothetical protein
MLHFQHTPKKVLRPFFSNEKPRMKLYLVDYKCMSIFVNAFFYRKN